MRQPLSLSTLPGEVALSERDLLLEICDATGPHHKVLLAGVDFNGSSFFDDIYDRSPRRFLIDNTLTAESLQFLTQITTKPLKAEVADIPQFQLCSASTTVWVLPYHQLDETQRWLVLFSGQRSLEEHQVEAIFLKLGLMLTKRKLAETEDQLEKANAWIDQELEEMTRLQQLMLPNKTQTVPGSKIAFTYRAMRGAGGDYIDFLSRCENPEVSGLHMLGMIVADVTGHGPSAAMEVAMMDAIIRTYRPAHELVGPSAILNYINKHFFTRKERSSFITAVACHYCPIRRRLLYANAGHPSAYIKRGQEIISLDGGGIPIGVMRDYEWEMYEYQIKPGDTLFVYTEVVIETKSPENHDFGFERLEHALKQSDNEPESLLKNMETKLKEFCQCKVFQDDMTMCAVQFV